MLQVSHKLYSAMQRRKFQQKARSLWQVEYPQEPFILDLDSDLYFADDDLPSRLSVDVLAAAVRQKIFFYQVTGLKTLKKQAHVVFVFEPFTLILMYN